MATYIGADYELPLIPWNEDKKGFNVQTLDENESKYMSGIIDKRFIYYLGSHEGCSCGFVIDDCDDMEEDEHDRLSRQSVYDLFNFLKDNIKTNHTFIIFSSWEGEQKEPITQSKLIDLSNFEIGNNFCFEQHEIITVKKNN